MKKNAQRINESQLRAIVAESVKKVLNEYAEGDEMDVKDFGIEEYPTHYEKCKDAIECAQDALGAYMNRKGMKMDGRGFGMDKDIYSLAMSLSSAWEEVQQLGND